MIRPIAYQDTFPLRKLLLNPDGNLKRPGDETARHFGFYQDNQLIGVISWYCEDLIDRSPGDQWRIRGMAIDSQYQGRQFGRLLVEESLHQLKDNFPVSFIWCRARSSAVGFYQRLGFTIIAEDPGHGQIMTRTIR